MCISHLNVYGSLEAKLECPDFVNDFFMYDIVFFSETWSNKNSILKLNGFVKPVCKHRPRKQNARRDSGGLCIFLKPNVAKGISEVDWDEFEDGIVLKLDKTFFGFVQDIFLVCTYIRPSTSSRNVTNVDLDQFDMLTDKISELIPKGEVIICGDFNSRTSGLLDLDDFEIIDLTDNVNVSEMNNVSNAIEKEDLISNNMSLIRTHMDKGVNEYGHILVRLCKMAGLVILNGRCKEDKNKGKLTFCDKKGKKIVKSTVDYFFVYKRNIE